jgi:ribosomal protein S18 acetylase RimI-like enzyme
LQSARSLASSAPEQRQSENHPRGQQSARLISAKARLWVTVTSSLMEFRAPLSSELTAVHELLLKHGWAHRIPNAAWLQEVLAKSNAVVAVSAGEVVGFARGVTDGLSNGHLSMVVVAEAHRRQGVGSRLVHAVMGTEPGITWLLRAERPGAREFFERLGFTPSSSAMERTRKARQ